MTVCNKTFTVCDEGHLSNSLPTTCSETTKANDSICSRRTSHLNARIIAQRLTETEAAAQLASSAETAGKIAHDAHLSQVTAFLILLLQLLLLK